MRRAAVGAVIAIALPGCGGSSPNPEELLIGTWLHEADPDIPSLVAYRDNGTMASVYEGGMHPGQFEGHWSIDDHHRLDMALACPNGSVGGPPLPCFFGSAIVDFQVSEASLTWIWGDKSQTHFHK